MTDPSQMQFETLQRRHRHSEQTLDDMARDGRLVGSDNWIRMQRREQALREERLRRALQRDGL
jgi:hypothetical protein